MDFCSFQYLCETLFTGLVKVNYQISRTMELHIWIRIHVRAYKLCYSIFIRHTNIRCMCMCYRDEMKPFASWSSKTKNKNSHGNWWIYEHGWLQCIKLNILNDFWWNGVIQAMNSNVLHTLQLTENLTLPLETTIEMKNALKMPDGCHLFTSAIFWNHRNIL